MHLNLSSSGNTTNKISNKIKSGDYYDAYQMTIALIHRHISKGHHNAALEYCYRFGIEFQEVDQIALTGGLGLLMVRVLEEFELPVTEEITDQIIQLFGDRFPENGGDHYRFIEQALKWATKEQETIKKSPSPSHSPVHLFVNKLHVAAGTTYLKNEEYGMAQAHFLCVKRFELLADLLEKWSKAVYPSEKYLLLLRAVLALLAQNAPTHASALFRKATSQLNMEDTDVPPPLQLAYLLSEACKIRNTSFFDTVKSKYSLVLRRDPSFNKLLTQIDQVYFGRNISQKPDIFGLMSRVFQMS